MKESMAVDIPQLCKLFWRQNTRRAKRWLGEKQNSFPVFILAGAFILLLVFVLVGLVDSLWELMNAIKKEPELGPLSVALKDAFCGCLPKKKTNPEGSSTKKDEEANNETAEKQNGAETMA